MRDNQMKLDGVSVVEGRRGIALSEWVLFGLISTLFSCVCDGWSGKPSPFQHQILLLPALGCLFVLLFSLLRRQRRLEGAGRKLLPKRWILWLGAFEFGSVAFFELEARHFHTFGYAISVAGWAGFAAVLVGVVSVGWFQRTSWVLFSGVLVVYGAGLVLAVCDFPLNYLRSDMLPVITWADTRIVHHLGPYDTMYVGGRVYDFPYLPGMLVAFLPTVAGGLDPRLANLGYLFGLSWICFAMARRDARIEVVALLGLFVLSPFLQYRHDLYLEPHWFSVVTAVCLMRRGRHVWAAGVWGVSCALYQLSWVLLPFVFLHAWRRRGISEVGKLAAACALGALAMAGPFLRGALSRVGHNTVGQWSHLQHALADPINLSYWVTFVVPPSKLMYVQAVLLTGLFTYCAWWRRCQDLADTLRWMSWALALFIALNVLVDGYFYLTLLLVLLLYVLVDCDWWKGCTPEEASPSDRTRRCSVAAG